MFAVDIYLITTDWNEGNKSDNSSKCGDEIAVGKTAFSITITTRELVEVKVRTTDATAALLRHWMFSWTGRHIKMKTQMILLFSVCSTLKNYWLSGNKGHETRSHRPFERLLLRSIVNMMIHVQIKITMKDYVDRSKETCVKTLKNEIFVFRSHDNSPTNTFRLKLHGTEPWWPKWVIPAKMNGI